MYKKNNTIGHLNDYICVNGHIYTTIEGKRKFQELSLKGEVLWQSKEKDIANYYVNKNVIMVML